MKIRPLQDRVLVKRIEEKETVMDVYLTQFVTQ